MGEDYLVARTMKVLRSGSSAGLSYYKHAKAKLDGYESLKSERSLRAPVQFIRLFVCTLCTSYLIDAYLTPSSRLGLNRRCPEESSTLNPPGISLCGVAEVLERSFPKW